ncbi:PIN domain-containing protein [Streptomyces sp. NPDC052101]|uniref:type II toxin-antitoxin system VapC family toxin n=1 Tax=Streptomyces sp. NPDC052101 TaxID=3155763 RepID=UPI003413D1A7
MENTDNAKIMIADSSGLVSLAVNADDLHSLAVAEARRLKQASILVVVPADVFSETVNILGKLSGHADSYATARELLAPGLFVHVETSDALRDAALEMFRDKPGSVSYTDCVVMTFAEHYETKNIFGFDDHFRKAGYQLPTKEEATSR